MSRSSRIGTCSRFPSFVAFSAPNRCPLRPTPRLQRVWCRSSEAAQLRRRIGGKCSRELSRSLHCRLRVVAPALSRGLPMPPKQTREAQRSLQPRTWLELQQLLAADPGAIRSLKPGHRQLLALAQLVATGKPVKIDKSDRPKGGYTVRSEPPVK